MTFVATIIVTIYCIYLIPRSSACWVSISGSGAGASRMQDTQNQSGTTKPWKIEPFHCCVAKLVEYVMHRRKYNELMESCSYCMCVYINHFLLCIYKCSPLMYLYRTGLRSFMECSFEYHSINPDFGKKHRTGWNEQALELSLFIL